MKIFICFFVFIFILLGCSDDLESDKLLTCEYPEHYTGRLSPENNGEIVVKHDFILRNNFSVPMKITAVPACICTKLKYNKAYINPKEEIKINLEMRYIPGVSGEKKETIIVSNSYNGEKVILKIISEPSNFYAKVPHNIYLGNLYSDEKIYNIKGTILLFTESENTKIIPKYTPQNASFKLEFVEKYRKRFRDGSFSYVNRYDYMMNILEMGVEGNHKDELEIIVESNPKFENIKIPITWSVKSDIAKILDFYTFSNSQRIVMVPLVFNKRKI